METILKLNSQLMNAPVGVIVGICAIAIGYTLKKAENFPNNKIPLVVIPFTALVFPIVQICADLMGTEPHPFLRIPVNVLIGVIIGFASWLCHYAILKRFIDARWLDDGANEQTKNETK